MLTRARFFARSRSCPGASILPSYHITLHASCQVFFKYNFAGCQILTCATTLSNFNYLKCSWAAATWQLSNFKNELQLRRVKFYAAGKLDILKFMQLQLQRHQFHLPAAGKTSKFEIFSNLCYIFILYIYISPFIIL